MDFGNVFFLYRGIVPPGFHIHRQIQFSLDFFLWVIITELPHPITDKQVFRSEPGNLNSLGKNFICFGR